MRGRRSMRRGRRGRKGRSFRRRSGTGPLRIGSRF